MTKPELYASSATKDRTIRLSMWVGGLHCSATVSPKDAAAFARSILAEIDNLPVEAAACDFGMAA